MEVYQLPNRQYAAKPREYWRAKILPTEQGFKGNSFKSAKEAQDTVAFNFRKQTSEWVEA